MTASAEPAAAVHPTCCPSCGAELLGKFCHQCGEKRYHEEELALKHFALHGLHELTHLDSKVFATVRYLVSRPGYLTEAYVAGRRSLYMKPLSLFLVVCALYFLVDSYFPRSVYDVYWLTRQDRTGNVEKLWTKLAAKKHVSKDVFMDRIQTRVHKLSTTMQFANVLVAAVVLALLYYKRYFVEHLVFAFHLMSFTFLMSSLVHPLTFKLDVYSWASYLASAVTLIVHFVYLFLALRRVYQQNVGLTLIKSFVVLLATWLAVVITQLVALGLGIFSPFRS